MVGNSSSGLLEVPTFNIGTVNIGDRQKGRLRAISVIDCEPRGESIKSALDTLFSSDFQDSLISNVNPYGDGNASDKILNILVNEPLPSNLKKVFYDL